MVILDQKDISYVDPVTNKTEEVQIHNIDYHSNNEDNEDEVIKIVMSTHKTTTRRILNDQSVE